MYSIIKKKKKGMQLSTEEIKFVVDGFTNGSIPDYQMSALLMAICLNGMNDKETYDLTMAMAESGDMLSLSKIKNITADKHSTGGVGDKTSLIVGPIAAANGVAIAKMSGRGLGHTGGTIDKLESIKGFKTEIDENEFINIVNNTGMAIIGQSSQLAPADKKIYALRDVTATVDNLSLIASSIMSKKLAAGAKIIVLDVKTGSGAFMKEPEDAKKLAETMVDIGKKAGRKMYALITDMNQPLGNFVGNKLEVYEAVKILKGEGPEDLLESSAYLSALILCGAGKAKDIEEGYKKSLNTIKDGRALNTFRNFIEAQCGDASFIDNIDDFCEIKETVDVVSEKDGFIESIDTEMIGMASLYLGGGRLIKEQSINHEVGLYINKKIGDKVNKGDVIVRLYADENSDVKRASSAIIQSYHITDKNIITANKHVYGYFDDEAYHLL